MKLNMVRHLWGSVGDPIELAKKYAGLGYTAIESPFHGSDDKNAEFAKVVQGLGMSWVAMAFTGGDSVQAHFDSFKQQIETGHKLGSTYMTAHTGSDAFSLAQSREFYGKVVEWEKSCPTSVGHETHRGRVFFNPWVTRDLLGEFPQLKLCTDLSHWVCVAERMLPDCGDIIKLVARHTAHIHARVGFEEGPQVPDPSAAEYQYAVDAHIGWWKTIFTVQKSLGKTAITVTPEFGPQRYMHSIPHTDVPVADHFKVCEYMTARVKQAFSEWEQGK
jgi:sugar phosphate isomerase/epimerase